MSLVATEPASLVAVHDQCAAIEAWAETCDSVPELQDATNRLAAIDEYLSRTSTEGRSRVAAAMRRLETRIGALIPPMSRQEAGARRGPRHDEDLKLTDEAKAHFRQMAEHPEVVEQVIAESTDDRPASRRSVTERIKDAKKAHPVNEKPRNMPLAERSEHIRTLAHRNFTSPQIADEIGVSPGRVREIARDTGVEIPADAVFGGRFRKVDPNRIINTVIEEATPEPVVLALVAYSELDRDRLEEWVSSLSEAISSLRKIQTALKKELTRDQA